MFTVTLPKYDNASWKFSKWWFSRVHPGSLISTILEQDPMLTHIELTEDVVTPEAMEFLYYPSDCGYPPYIDTGIDLTAAGRYLLCPLMGVMSNPLFSELLTHLQYVIEPIDLDLLYMVWGDVYTRMLLFGIKKGWIDLVRYLLEVLPGQPVVGSDEEGVDEEIKQMYAKCNQEGLFYAVCYDKVETMKLLIKAGADPMATISCTKLHELSGDDCLYSHIRLVQQVYPHTCPWRETGQMSVASIAIAQFSIGSLRYLAENKWISPEDRIFAGSFSSYHDMDVIFKSTLGSS